MAKVLIKSFCHNLATLVLLGPLMAIKILNLKCTVHLTILPCPLVLYPILPIPDDQKLSRDLTALLPHLHASCFLSMPLHTCASL